MKLLEPNFLGPPKPGMVYTALIGAAIAVLYSESLRSGPGGIKVLLVVFFFNFLHIGFACKITYYWMLRAAECSSWVRQIGRIAGIAALASLVASPFGMIETKPENWTLFMWLGKSLNCFGFTLGYALIETFVRVEVRRERAIGAAQRAVIASDRSNLATRLAALQAQIEPHFIYNTLGNVRALVRTSPEQADALLAHLIDYLRAALPSLRASSCTVAQELELASAYLAVMQVRLGTRLRWRIEADAATRALRCAPGAALTLTENAIKHGIDPLPEGGEVAVIAAQRDGSLVLEVRDTGAGPAPGEGSGVGLANLIERLALLYDGRARFDLTPNTPRGAVARVTIPLDVLTAVHADRTDP